MRYNVKIKLFLLITLTLAALILAIAIGGAAIPLPDIVRVLMFKLFGTPLPDGFGAVSVGLIFGIRLPRVLLSFVVGACLAMSGAVMQSVLKNPLASSYTIGVSSGAGLGAVLVIVGGLSSGVLGMFLLPIVAMSCGLLTVVLAMFFASRVNRGVDNFSIILMGMVLSVFANAVMMTLAARSSHFAQQITLWQMGSFALKGWSVVGILAPLALVGTAFFVSHAREMDALTFGEESAESVGISVKRVKWTLILFSSLLTGAAVAFVGVIGFVDLIAPHIIRRFFGSSHKYVVPLSGLFGGLFMVLADLIARTIASPSEIPVGSITALIGAPFFAYVFLTGRRKGQV